MVNRDVLHNIYESLLELSRKDLQIDRWLSGKNGRISGYGEFMNTLFDDCDFDLFVDKEVYDLRLTDEFIKELRIVRDSLNSYDEGRKTREEIIEDPSWAKIRKQSKKVVKFWNVEIEERSG